MASSEALVSTLKEALRARGITYSMVAEKLTLNETSVKRLMSGHTPMTLNRLDQICELSGLDVFELLKLAKPTEGREPEQLSIQQETSLAEEEDLFLCFYSLAKGLTVDDVVQKYRITTVRAQKALHRLERLQLIEVHPANKVKFLVPRAVRWRESGPLSQRYERDMEIDFLDHQFSGAAELRKFLTFPLSSRSRAQFARKIRDLMAEMQTQSEMDVALNKHLKETATVLFGFREWTPKLLSKFLR